MNENITPIKTAVVCMVYNGYEYLSEFLTYHLNLCDELFIIDHNSQRDLRQLDVDRVTFVRSNHEAQFQSECTNTVIEHFRIKENFDWLFVLDIDEFLPFQDKKSFHDFLKKHAGDKVLQFHWSNGVPFYDEETEQPKSLIDCKNIRFFHKDSVHFKSFVNIKKTKGNFIVPTGAHHIHRADTSLFSKLPFINRRKVYTPTISEFPLLHIVAFNKTAFVKKIKNYIDQMKYREHIKGQSGWVVRDYPDEFSNDEWLWYIANFRVSNPEQYYDTKREDFIENLVFSQLDKDQVISLRKKIKACSTTSKKTATTPESEYLRYKQDDGNILGNIKWFNINADNEIVTIVPAAYNKLKVAS